MITKSIAISILAILLYWFAIFIAYFYIHEYAGHYSANLFMGIAPEQMIVHFEKLFNVIPYPTSVQLIDLKPSVFSYFFGGFITGVLLLLLSTLLFWKLFKKKKQECYWWLFAITLGFSFAGFTECIFETFFLKYHRGIVELIILSFLAFGLAPLLSLWHYRSLYISPSPLKERGIKGVR